MRPLLERLRALPWPKYKPMDAIPVAKVPKRIRKALARPNNMVEDGEWVYSLTYRYLWREPFRDLQKRYDRLGDTVLPAFDALREVHQGRKENPLRAPPIPCFR